MRDFRGRAVGSIDCMKKEQLEKCRSSGRRTLSPRSTLAGQGGDFVPLARHSLPLHSSPSSPLIQNKNDPAKAGSFFFGKGRRTRTLNKGFGDPRVARATPTPFSALFLHS